jgi:predicted nucleic acid-binding protein
MSTAPVFVDRQVSLVDWTSFVLMRRRGTSEAFAFDDDFTRQGFTLFGSPG